MIDSHVAIIEEMQNNLIKYGPTVFLEPRSQFDKCIVGLDEEKRVLIYSQTKLIESLIQGYREEEPTLGECELFAMALEWYDFNMEGTAGVPFWPSFEEDLQTFSK